MLSVIDSAGCISLVVRTQYSAPGIRSVKRLAVVRPSTRYIPMSMNIRTLLTRADPNSRPATKLVEVVRTSESSEGIIGALVEFAKA